MTCVVSFTFALVAAVWTVEGTDGLGAENAEFTDVALRADGTVALAPALSARESLDEQTVWGVVRSSGQRLFVATGSKGRVYEILPGRSSRVAFDAGTGEVLALCESSGLLYFGLTPDGIVYRLRGSDAERHYETEEDYVFSLLPAPDGDILAATGTRGRLVGISPGGTGRVVYEAPQLHLTSLAWLEPGRDLLVGTAPDGIVYRLRFGSGSRGPEVSVLYDTPLAEVRSIAVTPGRVFVGANPDENTSEYTTAQVLCVTLDGVKRWQWSSPESTVFDLLPDGDDLLVATGSKGYVFRLDTLGHHARAQQVDEPNATCLYESGGNVWLGTGGPAALYRLGAGVAGKGELVSIPHDCFGPARFGRLEYHAEVPAGTELEFDTRTGNSELPDSTWHDWQPVSGTIKSPNARFVQWRAHFSSRLPNLTPVLRRVDVYYRAPNRPPVIGSVTVDGTDSEEAANGSSRPTRSISWEAEDPDSDSLVYEVQFKGEDETRWKRLAEDITETTHPVDTRALPDGWYRFRVKASDRATHPRELSLGTERTTLPVLVDNTPPEVTDISVDGTRLSFVVKDAASVISACRVSVNAGKWRPAEPEDGIFDATSEEFSLMVELEPGENTVAVQALDAQGNTAAGRKLIRQ